MRESRVGTKRTRGVVLLAVLVLGTLAPPSSAADETPDARLRKAYEEARVLSVAALEKLGHWCYVRKLLGERSRVAESILEIEPNHAAARRWLGYKRTKGGGWQRKTTYKRPSDRGTKAARCGVAGKRAALTSDAFALVEAAFHRHGAEASADERQRMIDLALWLQPESEAFRRTHGEVRTDAGWRLRETLAARESKGALRDLLERLKAETPRLRTATPRVYDEEFEFPWSKALETPTCRVLGTGKPGEVYTVVRAVHRGCSLARDLFEYGRVEEPSLTVWLLTRPGEYERLVRGLPLDDGERTRHLGLAGFWLPTGPTFVAGSGTAVDRTDAAVRVMILRDLAVLHPRAMETAGISVGLGTYLTHLTVGTRLSVVVEDSEYGDRKDQEGSPLKHGEGPWLELACDALERNELPTLVELMGSALNSLTWVDLLCANAFAAYLIEGCPDQRVAFLAKLGASGIVSEACVDAFVMDLPAVDRRLRRWLRELN